MDETVTLLKDLVETLEDGENGFNQVSDKLAENGHADLAGRMNDFALQRGRFAAELRDYSKNHLPEQVEEDGSVAAALHRGWISLADALTGDDPHAVLAAAETGEDHAVAEFDDALDDNNLSGDLRDIVVRQASEVRATHNEVRALRDSFAN